MQSVLLLIAVAVLGVFLYFVMKRLDDFLENGIQMQESEDSAISEEMNYNIKKSGEEDE